MTVGWGSIKEERRPPFSVAFFLHSPRAAWVMGLIVGGADLGTRPP